ncbi:TPA: helix-turn-helix domain-containing protein [Yersinia enterocolitica]|uniref:helix-turn-helix domain-containing protein n=4 Tax=Yersinia enterocolitica TaxID=630 RepID=UPI000ABCA942|nr:helix-turn-helix domain-containing protein [Yersinia enterocolitica]HDL8054409.1 helix-turn-helix domain-containing protein [Yersinia enterocolitica]HEI6849696.1 helix-turn-helix domain-containing protein [Yersinia enterocolitica]HEN3576241.1 helix-turn-helix domain-containing protein [Yersinia enterocolitica]HEN3579983.1 helix-turn-helix domain-containing protein [Yersinia enterocolitica]HEN3602231.1 helix-turn-helix domain-containing protein [Yersinia enterocolitica]
MNKHLSEIAKLIGNEIEEYKSSYYIKFKKNQRVDFKNNDRIYFLSAGCVSFYRYNDGVLTITKDAPFMLGLAQMKSEVKSHYVRCNTECEMWGISISDACILFDSKALWGHAFDILTDQVQEYFKREHMILQKNTYGIINEHLKHIWEMDEEVRKKTSIYSYILTRNHISRSAIHKIVREMMIAGDIIVNRGRLIDFKCPEKAF